MGSTINKLVTAAVGAGLLAKAVHTVAKQSRAASGPPELLPLARKPPSAGSTLAAAVLRQSGTERLRHVFAKTAPVAKALSSHGRLAAISHEFGQRLSTLEAIGAARRGEDVDAPLGHWAEARVADTPHVYGPLDLHDLADLAGDPCLAAFVTGAELKADHLEATTNEPQARAVVEATPEVHYDRFAAWLNETSPEDREHFADAFRRMADDPDQTFADVHDGTDPERFARFLDANFTPPSPFESPT